jgi:hypothetical protein
MNITLSSSEELTRSLHAGGTAWREGMVDDVRRAERIQAAQVTASIAELIELLHDRLVLCSVHGAISPLQQRAVFANSGVRPACPDGGAATLLAVHSVVARLR